MVEIHAKDDGTSGISVKVEVKEGSISDLCYLYTCITDEIARTLMQRCIPDAEAYMLLTACVTDTYKQYIEDREEDAE